MGPLRRISLNTRERRRRALLAASLVTGVVIRLGVYVSRPALTIDETTLSLDLGRHDFRELLHPLASLQTAPPLFLWVVKLCTVLFGMGEYALRLVPLLGGVAVVILAWSVGRRVTTEAAALAATGLTTFSPALIQYSVTVKPYITDAAFTLLLMACTLDVLERPDARVAWGRLALIGALAVLGSIPAPFLLTGVTACVLVGVRPLGGQRARHLAACVALWVALFVPVFLLLYRPIAGTWYMHQFWDSASFAPLRAVGWWNLARGAFMAIVGRSAPPAVIIAIAAVLCAGLWIWLRRSPRAVAALVGAPLFLLVVASALHRYPLAARLLLFVTPTFSLALGALFAGRSRWPGRFPLGSVAAGITVVLLLGVDVVHPYRPPATRAAIDSLERLARPGEPVYIASGGVPAWAFYTTDWAAPDTLYLDWVGRVAGTPGAAAFHNSPPRGRVVTADEGANLTTWRRGRVELLGLAPGIQWLEGRGFGIPVVTDSGWARREGARIAAAASPTVWVVTANAYPTTVPALSAAIAAAGGTVEVQSAVGGVRLVRYRFSSTPPP